MVVTAREAVAKEVVLVVAAGEAEARGHAEMAGSQSDPKACGNGREPIRS